MVKKITYNSFIERYIKALPAGFKWQTTPLQIYPLKFIANYLILPTPLLQADYHFLVYLNEGNFSQQIGIENHDINASSVLYVPEGEVSSIKSKQNKLSGFFILIENKVVSSIVSKVELSDLLAIEPVIRLNSENDHWFNAICDLLYNEISSNKPNRKVGEGLLQALLHKLIALNNGKKTISRQNEIANNFKQLLNTYFREHKSVEFYAKELNVSQNYLNRCVKAHYNKSCKHLVQETTVLQSQVLMFETSKNISEISFKMGFEDPSYFSRVFKKITGQPPSAFKKQIMHGLS